MIPISIKKEELQLKNTLERREQYKSQLGSLINKIFLSDGQAKYTSRLLYNDKILHNEAIWTFFFICLPRMKFPISSQYLLIQHHFGSLFNTNMFNKRAYRTQ